MRLRDQVRLAFRKLRHIRSISQEGLANAEEDNRGYVGKLENAKCSATLDMIELITDTFDFDPSVLLTACGSPHPKIPHQFNDQSFEKMTISTPSDRHPSRALRRLKAKPFQEGVIVTKGEAIVVWKDYTWNTGEVSRYWKPGFESVPENVIRVRKISAGKQTET